MGYFILEEFQTVREYIQKAIQIQEDMGIQLWTSTLNSFLGRIETELGNFKSAQDYAEKGLDIAQKNSERLLECFAWSILGRVLGKKEPAEIKVESNRCDVK